MSTTSNETLGPLSAQEKSSASDYLASTRDALLQAVDELSLEQWRFKPTADRWSIGQILEHLAIVESRVHALVGRMSEAPAAGPDRKDSEIDDFILAAASKVTKRFEAPPTLQPTGQHSPERYLRQFLADRAHTIRLLEVTPSLAPPSPFCIRTAGWLSTDFGYGCSYRAAYDAAPQGRELSHF